MSSGREVKPPNHVENCQGRIVRGPDWKNIIFLQIILVGASAVYFALMYVMLASFVALR